MTGDEVRDTAWSWLLEYAAVTGPLAGECEHARIQADEVTRLREKSAAIREAACALAGMCVLDVETVRTLIEIASSSDWMPSAGPDAIEAATAEMRRCEGRGRVEGRA